MSGASHNHRRERQVLVLCYHAVSEDWPAAMAVRPESLRAQLKRFRRQGFASTTFTEAVTGTAPGRFMAITFDDAYRSVVELAKPILDELEMTATVFVPTSKSAAFQEARSWPEIDHWKERFANELSSASWDELRSLHRFGWELGAHTRTHPKLTLVGDRGRLDDEIAGSKADVEEQIDAECTSFAYPFGLVDDEAEAAVARAGYRAAAALSDETSMAMATNPLRWPRLGVYRSDSPSRMMVKGWLYARGAGSWNALQRVRTRRGAGATARGQNVTAG
ncbi:polysaccharide deacetylase family protein [Thermoleophilia bacterium SCSIO 60948]|nr:polysaccharide deacetylase family protein [Thermoleophilia bacterium SCSIO 60948]